MEIRRFICRGTLGEDGVLKSMLDGNAAPVLGLEERIAGNVAKILSNRT